MLSNLWGPITMVFVVRDALCAGADPQFFGRMLSVTILYAVICTFLQDTFGSR